MVSLSYSPLPLVREAVFRRKSLIQIKVILESPRQFGITSRAFTNGSVHEERTVVVHNQTNRNGTESTETNGLLPKQVDGNGITPKEINGNGNGALPKHASSNGHTHEKDEHRLLLFSAYTAGALESQIDAYRDYITRNNANLGDFAYTLANRREQKPYRAYSVTKDISLIETSATQVAQKLSPRVVWVFTGQGAQWPEMGANLIDDNIIFRSTIRTLDKFLLSLPNPPSWTIESM